MTVPIGIPRAKASEIQSVSSDVGYAKHGHYFTIWAPRQTGKTTCLLALADRLNREGRYRALYANIEAAQAARGADTAGECTEAGRRRPQ